MPYDPEEMDFAAKEFKDDLESLLESMTPDQRKGVDLLLALVDKYTASAGYKRMCRIMLSKRRAAVPRRSL